MSRCVTKSSLESTSINVQSTSGLLLWYQSTNVGWWPLSVARQLSVRTISLLLLPGVVRRGIVPTGGDSVRIDGRIAVPAGRLRRLGWKRTLRRRRSVRSIERVFGRDVIVESDALLAAGGRLPECRRLHRRSAFRTGAVVGRAVWRRLLRQRRRLLVVFCRVGTLLRWSIVHIVISRLLDDSVDSGCRRLCRVNDVHTTCSAIDNKTLMMSHTFRYFRKKSIKNSTKCYFNPKFNKIQPSFAKCYA